jgi:nucleotide-binding universal stress UspA family protein
MFTNILWATDGSEPADRALGYAVQIAHDDHTQLHVVHVVEKLVAGRIAGQNVSLSESDVVAKIRAQTASVHAQGITPTLHVIADATGHVAGLIAEVADETGADLIVVGTRGHSALGGLLLGSVTQRLLHVATCPVLAIPPAVAAPAPGVQPDALRAAM